MACRRMTFEVAAELREQLMHHSKAKPLYEV
jgi:hypothetical protein